MKKNIKLIALLSVVIMLTTVTVSCKSEPQFSPSDTTGSVVIDTSIPPSGEELVETPETITIKEKDYALNYEITRPQSSQADSVDVKTAQNICMILADQIGRFPTIGTDWAKEEDPEKLEIIVGATDHPETEELLDAMKTYGDYAVRAIGNKIILMAFNEEGYSEAFEHLKDVFDKGLDKETKTITLSVSDINKIGTLSDQLSRLPLYDGGRFYALYDAGRVTADTECDEIIVKTTTVGEYDEYMERLEANGYTQYAVNNMGNNKFATYTNSEYTINVGYYDYEKSVRLLIEPKGALPTRAEDNKTAKRTTSQITMLAVANGNSQNGLSVLIRLEDGRFIVVDGAFNNNEVRDVFISTIKEQAKEYGNDNPVIAAWIVTHAHGDHTGMLYGKYKSIKDAGITVESIIMNEISETETERSRAYVAAFGTSGTYSYGDTEGGQSKRIIETIAPYFGAELYKAHIGQSFHLSNCRMDVLYSLEGYAPNMCNAFNTTSIVIKMTFTDSATGKETTFLSTGDATGFAMGVANDIFGDLLKSDILSVSHHGYGTWGGDSYTMEAYKRVSPTLLLWPVGDSDYFDVSSRIYNQTLFSTASYKESYHSGNIGGQNIIVPIPYVVGNVILRDQ